MKEVKMEKIDLETGIEELKNLINDYETRLDEFIWKISSTEDEELKLKLRLEAREITPCYNGALQQYAFLKLHSTEYKLGLWNLWESCAIGPGV